AQGPRWPQGARGPQGTLRKDRRGAGVILKRWSAAFRPARPARSLPEAPPPAVRRPRPAPSAAAAPSCRNPLAEAPAHGGAAWAGLPPCGPEPPAATPARGWCLPPPAPWRECAPPRTPPPVARPHETGWRRLPAQTRASAESPSRLPPDPPGCADAAPLAGTRG